MVEFRLTKTSNNLFFVVGVVKNSSLKMDAEEKKDVVADTLTISKLKVTGQVIISRANQQLKLEDNIRTLNNDVTRLSRLGKARIDALDDMERRLRRMRHQLKTTTIPTVNDSVAADLYVSNRVQVDVQFTICTRCQRRILVKLMKAHDTACAKLKSKDTVYMGSRPVPKVDDEVQGLIDTYATFVPQPPRNIMAKAKGTTFVVWTWDPPVFEGGLPVLDYEISYTANIVEFDKSIGKYKRYTEVCRSLLTTTCIRPMPVAHNGYTMVGLRADTEYTDLIIRCRNDHGWSQWVPMVTKIEGQNEKESASGNLDLVLNKSRASMKMPKRRKPGIMTDPADPPSPPLFFVCTEITSGCIHLQWDVPFYDGGLPIIEYRVSYTVLERTVTATSRNVIIERPNTVKIKTPKKDDSIPGTTIKFIIRNLPADTDVVDITVKAMNLADLISDPRPLCGTMFPRDEEKEREEKEKKEHEAQLANMRAHRRGLKGKGGEKDSKAEDGPGPRGIVCRTKVASRYRQLELQLRAALEQDGEFIDTDFYTVSTDHFFPFNPIVVITLIRLQLYHIFHKYSSYLIYLS